ncbi:hypothetical protein DPEC_G00062980 [Dallia pectoralis]|uniref:Uncharacterized protein n=1 Tax=Dallia pectoralis TaxID=75939 RepID=A0ACC2H7D2_DALPE|nr:hypothetical protein DPEC_G00062980 [Dallia pectoralis]
MDYSAFQPSGFLDQGRNTSSGAPTSQRRLPNSALFPGLKEHAVKGDMALFGTGSRPPLIPLHSLRMWPLN